MSKLSAIMKILWTDTQKHSVGILITVGTGGLISAVGMGIGATVKAVKHIENELDEDATPKEIVKSTWKFYIPTLATTVISTGCIIGASNENRKRNMALTTAYTLSEAAMKEYSDKVVETIGKKKEKEIRDSIAEDKVRDNPVSANQVIVTDRGDTLCYDSLSGRYFKSNIDKVKQAFIDLNYKVIHEMYASVNDLYYLLGIDCVPMYDDLGWNINNGAIELNYTYTATESGDPCLVLNYNIEPRYDYQNY